MEDQTNQTNGKYISNSCNNEEKEISKLDYKMIKMACQRIFVSNKCIQEWSLGANLPSVIVTNGDFAAYLCESA